jgi:antitoxin VapB
MSFAAGDAHGRRVPAEGGRQIEVSLNIKNTETHRLARELAALTGESLTGAITTALRERLDRLRKDEHGGLADHLLAIGRDCAARLEEPYRSVDHADLLYDDKGLPR